MIAIKKIIKISIISLVISTSASSCYYNNMHPHAQNETLKGAGVGAAIGAVTGAIVGKQSDKPVTGAAIGAVAGGALGGYQGRQTENQKQIIKQQEERIRRLEERAYDR